MSQRTGEGDQLVRKRLSRAKHQGLQETERNKTWSTIKRKQTNVSFQTTETGARGGESLYTTCL